MFYVFWIVCGIVSILLAMKCLATESKMLKIKDFFGFSILLILGPVALPIVFSVYIINYYNDFPIVKNPFRKE